MIEEARKAHEWSSIDTAEWLFGGLTGVEATKSNLREFKDEWIKGNRTTISVIARKYGIPPEMLAGIAWSEVGGEPQIMDDIAAIGRGVGVFSGTPAMTSIGDVQIQARHIATMRGIDPNTLGAGDIMRMRRELERNRALNLQYVAQHIAELRDAAWPDRPEGPLTEDEIERLGYMYNVGFRSDLADKTRPVDRALLKSRFRSEYGIDLVNKLQRMRTDLDLD